MNYASFWRRLLAHLVDLVILAPTMYLFALLFAHNKLLAMSATVIVAFSYFAYSLFLHGLYGQTIGKRVARLRVLTVEGEPITMRTSMRRNLLYFIGSFPWGVATFVAMSRIPPEKFLGTRDRSYYRLEEQMRPDWYSSVPNVFLVVVAAEIAMLLYSTKKQSIHDLIGRTVVVRLPRNPKPTAQS